MAHKIHGLDFSPQPYTQGDDPSDINIDALVKMIEDHVMAHHRIPRTREIEAFIALCAIHKEK